MTKEEGDAHIDDVKEDALKQRAAAPRAIAQRKGPLRFPGAGLDLSGGSFA
jgi:hypothetical protein